MKQGYDVFGKAWAVMLRNDLHHPNSVDHCFLREMILLDEETRELLYSVVPAVPQNISKHELYPFAQQFRQEQTEDSVKKALSFVGAMAEAYDFVPFEEMLFGGTEKQILERGSDWCADLARLGLVLLNCLDIPARIIHAVNIEKAYYGHVVVEAYVDGRWRVCDFVSGEYCLRSAWELHASSAEQYRGVAVNNYDPMATDNDYSISGPNEYYRHLMKLEQNGQWLMDEDK